MPAPGAERTSYSPPNSRALEEAVESVAARAAHRPLVLARAARAARVEAAAVVRDAQQKLAAFEPELDFRARRARVLDGVVDALLEDEEDLAPEVRAETHVALGVRRGGAFETYRHAARREHVAREAAHSVDEV